MSGQPPSCKGCPLYGKAGGWVLGSGNPFTAKLALIFESPWRTEIFWEVEKDELVRRQWTYPMVPEKFLRIGEPVAGSSGFELFGWALTPFGISRKDVYVDNSIRCAVDLKTPAYPKGDERKSAEAYCSTLWDRGIEQFISAGEMVCKKCSGIMRYEPSSLPMWWEAFQSNNLPGNRWELHARKTVSDVVLLSIVCHTQSSGKSPEEGKTLPILQKEFPSAKGEAPVERRKDVESDMGLSTEVLFSPLFRSFNSSNKQEMESMGKGTKGPSQGTLHPIFGGIQTDS